MARRGTRDNFPPKVTQAVALRAGYFCSFPTCRKHLIAAANGDPERAIKLGNASHINAASPGGPRYDPTQTSDERRSIQNAIFLCDTHASRIDKHGGIDFTAEALREMKRLHEDWIADNIGKSIELMALSDRPIGVSPHRFQLGSGRAMEVVSLYVTNRTYETFYVVGVNILLCSPVVQGNDLKLEWPKDIDLTTAKIGYENAHLVVGMVGPDLSLVSPSGQHSRLFTIPTLLPGQTLKFRIENRYRGVLADDTEHSAVVSISGFRFEPARIMQLREPVVEDGKASP